MFETIGTLFTIGFWVVAIFLFLGGIFICIGNLLQGTGLEKCMASIALILGIVTFFWMYDWARSIAWCLLTSGLVFGFVAGLFSDSGERNPSSEEKYDFGDAYLDAYAEYQLQKQATKDAIKELNNEL